MSYSAERRTLAGRKKRSPDPFRYGVRLARQKMPNGKFEYVQTPMPKEALLHPLDEDFPVEGHPHNRDCVYLKNVLETRLPRYGVVLMNCRVDWEVPGVEPHGPDVVVFDGVRSKDDWQTFHVRQENARPVLVVEITSRNTRSNDLKIKVDEYYRAGVPFYVIVDARKKKNVRILEIIGYRAGPNGYERLPLDEHGRLLLQPVGLLLGAENRRVCCYHVETGERIGDYDAVVKQREQAEEKIRQLEAELRKLRGKG